MGIEWEFNNQDIINLKNMEIIFKVGDLKVTVSLDPKEGRIYLEPARGVDI
jgi:hypothetical protein